MRERTKKRASRLLAWALAAGLALTLLPAPALAEGETPPAAAEAAETPDGAAREAAALIETLPTAEEYAALLERAIGAEDPGYGDWLAEVQEAREAARAAAAAYDALTDTEKALVAPELAEKLDALLDALRGSMLRNTPAADFEGTGGENDPYFIKTYADLAVLAAKCNDAKYKDKYFQVKDGFSQEEGQVTAAIGSSDLDCFGGHFDGNGQTIRLAIDQADGDHLGLFGYLPLSAVVENVTVSGSVQGRDYVGGIAGVNQGTVQNCRSEATVTGRDNVGGIAGENHRAVQGCSNTGEVAGRMSVGGLAGNNLNCVKNGYNTAAVTGTSINLGGIAGNNSRGTSAVESCYNTGDVTAENRGNEVGGVVGNNFGTVRNCLSLGLAVTGTTIYTGGVIGYNNGGTSADNQTRADLALHPGGTLDGISGDPLAVDGSMTLSAAFSAWETAVWTIPGGNLEYGCGLPTLTGAPQSPAPKLPGSAPHAHDMSVDCGSDDPITFAQALTTSPEGALYIDGVEAGKDDGGYKLPAGNYYLAADLELNRALSISGIGTVNLCLNGHMAASSDGASYVIYVSGGTLDLCDCNGSNSSHPITSPVTGQSVTITGGLIAKGTLAGIFISPDPTGSATLNLYGGTIAGNRSSESSAGVENFGTFTMRGGTITHNAGVTGGVGNSGTFTMSGGAITHNAGYSGGVTNVRTFKMSGGAITDNSGTVDYAGGIYTATATVTLSGSPTISGNAVGEGNVPSNLYLPDGLTVTIGDNFAPTAPIGVTTEAAPGANAPVNITAAGSQDYARHFTSDNARYAVENSGTGSDQVVRLTLAPPAGFEGLGTAESPYLLKSYAHLETLAEKVNGGTSYQGKFFRLDAAFPTDSGAVTTAIGTGSKPFQGSFDGNGKTVALAINAPGSNNQGLFGSASTSATIQNVAVSGSVVGWDNVGGVAGSNYGTVKSCYSTATVTGSNDNGSAGGVVGDNAGTVEHCYNTGAVTGGSYVGGVVGTNNTSNGIVQFCYNTGAVTASTRCAGGVVGGNYNSGQVRNCLSLGLTVTGPSNVGRVVGFNFTEDYVILADNAARADMALLVNGAAQAVTGAAADGPDGADLAVDGTAAAAAAFPGWAPAVWTVPESRLEPGLALPVLNSVPQSPAPVLPGTAVQAAVQVTPKDGTPVGYRALADGLDAAKASSGSTLRLLTDVTGSAVCGTGTFTIDLNGRTWAGTSDGAALKINGTASVTLTDSAGGGRILGAAGVSDVNDGRGQNAVYLSSSDAALTLTGENAFTLQGGDGANQEARGGNGGYGVYVTRGTFTVQNSKAVFQGGDGGRGTEPGDSGRGCEVAGGSFSITGGVFRGGDGSGSGHGLNLSSATALAPLTVTSATGGTNGYGLNVLFLSNKLTIAGGVFQGTFGIQIGYSTLTITEAIVSGKTGLSVDSGSTAEISGGTFTGTDGYAIKTTKGAVSGLLADGYAYFQDGGELFAGLDGKTLAQNGTVTVAPERAPRYAVSGTVTEESGAAVEGADVTLRQGSAVFGRTTTDREGKYTFARVRSGTYNVVAEKSPRTMTILVVVDGGDVTEKHIVMPDGNVSSVLNVQGAETPAVVVGGGGRPGQAGKQHRNHRHRHHDGGGQGGIRGRQRWGHPGPGRGPDPGLPGDQGGTAGGRGVRPHPGHRKPAGNHRPL